MKKLTLHILFIALVQSSWAQKVITFEELKPIYEKMTRYYNNDYAFYTQLFSYKGHQNNAVEDQSAGYVIKKNTVIESYQMGTYSIQDLKVKVMIDSTEKMVGLTYPDTTRSMNFEQYKLDYKLKLIEKITFQSNDKFTLIDFYYKKSYQYERVTLKVKNTGFIEEMTLYFSNELVYEAADGSTKKAKAKVKMTFTEIPSKDAKIKFRIQDIVVNTGKEYKTTEPFKKFELIDFRYQN